MVLAGIAWFLYKPSKRVIDPAMGVTSPPTAGIGVLSSVVEADAGGVGGETKEAMSSFGEGKNRIIPEGISSALIDFPNDLGVNMNVCDGACHVYRSALAVTT